MQTTKSQFHDTENITITLNGVIKMFMSAGPDNLGPEDCLKELADEVAPLLLLTYRKSLEMSKVPTDGCKANVICVFNK